VAGHPNKAMGVASATTQDLANNILAASSQSQITFACASIKSFLLSHSPD
jgi:hypothetical protein